MIRRTLIAVVLLFASTETRAPEVPPFHPPVLICPLEGPGVMDCQKYT